MNLRPLTVKEKLKIRAVKEQANKDIAESRKLIRQQLQEVRKGPGSYARSSWINDLNDRLDKLKRITGQPVIVEIEGNSITVNYGTLSKLFSSLRRSKKMVECIHVLPGKLKVSWGSGVFELVELPQYQKDSMRNLPVISW